MAGIEHRYVEVNGLKLHVAEAGGGNPAAAAVVFLHGFPEIWYSWRHQMIAVAGSGFRAIAPDYRGYGLSDPPPQPENTTFADLIGLLDSLSISKVYLIAKDFGARIAYIFSLLHSDRLFGIITLGVPFRPPNRHHTVLNHLNEGSYVSRWKEPGRAEADFSRFDCKTVIKNIYILFSRTEVPTAVKNQEIMDMVDSSTPLPHWFSEEDLAVYCSHYEKSGFQTALQVPYRSLHEEFDVANLRVEVPALVIIGGKDYSLKFPGVEDYIKSGGAKTYVPKYETAYLPEGCHFMQEQFPDQVNRLIISFLTKYS
ncbi:hypothetical protein ACJIZ3_006456 [Penstemon smallii]|uniref:AB hydrolase-1 domain-containing protein n=1 Tax=Penstemon smallii TaxID=265156 RepID=A0ABD3S7Q7_9LAMI